LSRKKKSLEKIQEVFKIKDKMQNEGLYVTVKAN